MRNVKVVTNQVHDEDDLNMNIAGWLHTTHSDSLGLFFI